MPIAVSFSAKQIPTLLEAATFSLHSNCLFLATFFHVMRVEELVMFQLLRASSLPIHIFLDIFTFFSFSQRYFKNQLKLPSRDSYSSNGTPKTFPYVDQIVF